MSAAPTRPQRWDTWNGLGEATRASLLADLRLDEQVAGELFSTADHYIWQFLCRKIDHYEYSRGTQEIIRRLRVDLEALSASNDGDLAQLVADLPRLLGSDVAEARERLGLYTWDLAMAETEPRKGPQREGDQLMSELADRLFRHWEEITGTALSSGIRRRSAFYTMRKIVEAIGEAAAVRLGATAKFDRLVARTCADAMQGALRRALK